MSQPPLKPIAFSRTTKYEEELLEMRSQHHRRFAGRQSDATDAPTTVPDPGVRGWLFMLSAFLIEALLWGTYIFHLFISSIVFCFLFVVNSFISLFCFNHPFSW
jgi:hypothetical protein